MMTPAAVTDALTMALQRAWSSLHQALYLYPVPSSTVHTQVLDLIKDAQQWLRVAQVERQGHCLERMLALASENVIPGEILRGMAHVRRCYSSLCAAQVELVEG